MQLEKKKKKNFDDKKKIKRQPCLFLHFKNIFEEI
jgi:hypothetical protein